MRDKHRDKEYFDYCIRYYSQETEKLKAEINSYTDQSDLWVLDRKNLLLKNKVNILTAKYSRGDPLSDLKKEFEQLTDCFMKFWIFDEEGYHFLRHGSPIDYFDDMRFASLALLFNTNTQIKDKIRNKLKEALYYDCFIENLLGDTDGLPDKESLAEPELVMEFVCAAEQHSCEPLAEYLQKWYHSSKYVPWGVSGHGIYDYCGKWAFEAAAVAKNFSLNDKCLKNDPFYPYDLAHFID